MGPDAPFYRYRRSACIVNGLDLPGIQGNSKSCPATRSILSQLCSDRPGLRCGLGSASSYGCRQPHRASFSALCPVPAQQASNLTLGASAIGFAVAAWWVLDWVRTLRKAALRCVDCLVAKTAGSAFPGTTGQGKRAGANRGRSHPGYPFLWLHRCHVHAHL